MANSPFGNCPLCQKPIFAVKMDACVNLQKLPEIEADANGPAYEFSPCGCRAVRGVEPACYQAMQDAVRKAIASTSHAPSGTEQDRMDARIAKLADKMRGN
jgi:hypothetical protein